MEAFILDNEREIFTVGFFGTVAFVAFWESIRPRRPGTQPLKLRWIGNFAIALIDLGTIKLVFPVAALAFAFLVADWELGLFPVLDLPAWLAVPLGVILLELGRWLHHFLLHKLPILWRFHRIHHADHDYDFTVGLRFHPIEGLFTTAFIFPIILLTGMPPVAVLIAELLVGVSGLIVHANGQTGPWIERYVRLVFVTPDMHRIHHSVIRAEHDSNYAAVFSFWDRLFGTYTAAPVAGQQGMTIGLPDLRDTQCLKLGWMLLSPFRPTTPSPRETPTVERITADRTDTR